MADVYDPTPGPEPRPRVMRQRWTRVSYLHWPCDPDAMARRLPAGVWPDTFEGRSWVGLIAFVMRDVSVLGAPPLPYLSHFLEMNVRVYTVDARGRRSVVFLSLDADRMLPVAAARVAYRLPYIWSRMSFAQDGERLTYVTRRRRGGAGARIVVRVGETVPATPLDDFLTARWGLHHRWWGGSAYVPIRHEPWPLRAAELVEVDEDLILAAGLPAPAGPPRVLYSEGVEVRLGTPSPLRV